MSTLEMLRRELAPHVPNQQPIITPCPLAIVGEAPGANEVKLGLPFVGYSGALIWDRLTIPRQRCFVGNVCQHRPPNNDIVSFGWNSPYVQDGIKTLFEDLRAAKPNLIVAFGATALHVLREEKRPPIVVGGRFRYPNSIDDWRGSLWWNETLQAKCLAIVHPARVLRDYSQMAYFTLDIHRAIDESISPKLVLPEHRFNVAPSLQDVCQRLDEISGPVAVDIEGGVEGVTCISFATSKKDAFIVPLECGYWKGGELPLVIQHVCRVLSNPTIPKILQNFLYDAFVLGHRFSVLIDGLVDDTMLAQWELLPELDKSLAVQASIYTKQPFYKMDRNSPPGERLFTYCCTDSAVTMECRDAMLRNMSPEGLKHYRFNVSLLAPLLYMELRGVRYDTVAAAAAAAEVKKISYELQHRVNLGAGRALKPGPELLQLVQSKCGTVRSPTTFKKAYEPFMARIMFLATSPSPTDGELGELSILTGMNVNVDSPKQMQSLLYDEWGLPRQYKKEHGRKTDKLSTDASALLSLFRDTKDERLIDLLRLRAAMTELETLEASADADGRVRCAYNIVGTETGRMACYTSPTGSGYNLQTVTKKHRHLFRADPDMWFFQCDLSGADGWTVAAECAALGDRTMLEDYLAGASPAKVGVLIKNEGPHWAHESSVKLAEACKHIDKKSWDYFAFKRVQHGANYGLGNDTMSDQILKDSYKLTGKPVYIPPDECKRYRELYLTRYKGVLLRHQHIKEKVMKTARLKDASGHVRVFGGRLRENATHREAYAHTPQSNTTYVTNMALHRLWYDKENRTEANKLIVEPLHQVHDALNGQFPRAKLEWARTKIREWFNNPITVDGVQVTIPFEGTYGESWGDVVGTI